MVTNLKRVQRLFSLSLTVALLIVIVPLGGAHKAVTPTHASAQSVATPLPLTCSGTPAPDACAYGYVYYNGLPVAGASVRIDSPYGTLNTTTANGTLSSVPYYQANLSGSPLLVSPGDTITVTATHNGKTASTAYVGEAGGQQADVILVQSFDDWWDTDYAYRRPLPISASSTLGAGTIIKVDGMDLESLVSQGEARTDHNDIRVAHRISANNWQEIERVYYTGWDLEFKLAATMSPGTDTSYYIYYGNPSAGSPPSFSLPQGWLVDMYHDKWWSDYGGTWSFDAVMNFDNVCDPWFDHDGKIGSSFDESDKFRGRLYIPYDGTWTFRLYTNDGYRIYIDGAEVGHFDGYDGSRWVTVGSMSLKPGWHRMELGNMWVNCGAWKFHMSGPSFPDQLVPAHYFQQVWDGVQTGITPGNEEAHLTYNPPIVTFNYMNPNAVVQQGQTLALKGTAIDDDEQGNSITQYVWRSDLNGVLGTQASLTVNTSSLAVGTHTIFFKAKDNEDVWSDEVSRQLIVQLTTTPTPTNTPVSSTPTPTPTNTPPPTTKSWTFLLYLAGDNNLYPYLQRAISQLEAQPANPNLNIVVLFDGDRANDSWRFLVQPGGNYTIGVNKWYLGEVNMGHPQTLTDFITWTHANYPAQNYYFAIADHGRGTSGVAWDDTNSHDYLTTAELRTALSTATNSGQWKIDVLHYDTCLMGMLENAYQAKDFVDYMVASENLGWSVFAYDQYARSGQAALQGARVPYAFATVAARVSATTTPRELAVSVADAYFNHVSLQGYPRTISVLDLSRAGAVKDAVSNLAAALRSDLNTWKNYIYNTRTATQKFDSRDYYKITNEDEYLDVYDFAQRIKQNVSNGTVQSAAQGVMDAINGGFVVVESHQSGTYNLGGTELYWDLDGSHGVSMYFPSVSGGYGYSDYVNNILFSFTADSQWDEFLGDFFGVMGLPPGNPNDPGLPPFMSPGFNIYLPLIIRNQ